MNQLIKEFEQSIYIEYNDIEYALDVDISVFDGEIDEVIITHDTDNLKSALFNDNEFVAEGMNIYVENNKLEINIVDFDTCFDYLENN